MIGHEGTQYRYVCLSPNNDYDGKGRPTDIFYSDKYCDMKEEALKCIKEGIEARAVPLKNGTATLTIEKGLVTIKGKRLMNVKHGYELVHFYEEHFVTEVVSTLVPAVLPEICRGATQKTLRMIRKLKS